MIKSATKTLMLAMILIGCEEAVPTTSATFEITIQNLSSGEFATNFSRGVYLTKNDGFPLFFDKSQDFGKGLSSIAGDGIVDPLLANLLSDPMVLQAGSFDSVLPGSSITIDLEASYGSFFNFATMFVESNDLFYAFDDDGIHLFEPDGTPISGDFTQLVWLWDVGKEQNQAPYTGSFQAPRQSMPGEGLPENGEVRLVKDAFSYPPKTTVIRIIINSTKR